MSKFYLRHLSKKYRIIFSSGLFAIILINLFLPTAKAEIFNNIIYEVPFYTWDVNIWYFGNTDYYNVYQKYTAFENQWLCKLTFRIGKKNNPIDSIRVKIFTSGFDTLITTSPAILGSSLSNLTSPNTPEVTFILDNCIYLTADRTYRFLIERTGELNNTNNYFINIQSSPALNQFYLFIYNSFYQQYQTIQPYQPASIFKLIGEQINLPALEATTTSGFQMYSTSTLEFENKDLGLFGNLIRDVLKFLFVPDSSIFNNFANLWNMIKDKVPIGYFYKIKEAFNGLGTSTPAFILPVLTAFDNIFTPLKIGISIILWLLFIKWLFNRIKHLEL